MPRWNQVDAMTRFFSHVDIPADIGQCWLWTGGLSPGGYGRFGDHGHVYAHRFIFEAVHGPIPEGLSVDHVCFTPACVNPVHMRLLPHAVNTSVKRSALAQRCKRGHEALYVKPCGKRICRTCNNKETSRRKREQRHHARLI